MGEAGGLASGTLPSLARYVAAWPPLAAGAGSLGASFPKQASFLPVICVCAGGCRSSKGRGGLASCHCSLPSQAGCSQPCPGERGSREHGGSPPAALGSTGVLVALLSRAAASHGGLGTGNKVTSGELKGRGCCARVVERQGTGQEGPSRGRSPRGVAEAHGGCLIPRQPLAAGSDTNRPYQGAMRARGCRRPLRVPALPLPAVSPSGSRPAGLQGRAGCSQGLLLPSRGHLPPCHATLLLQLAPS